MDAFDRHRAVTSTTLGEIARAISELHIGFDASPEEELKVLKDLFRQRAALKNEHISDDLCGLAACFILEAMVRQQIWNLELFRRSQSPFCIR